ncbi:spore cortex-lytic enzyme [Falsibacillus albus]|uniref:Spore cortex-lytic enzyme n=1 Tax=Falsibacillus albus TaxID=2478915 RepID=A0A3L7JW42_9BACI|nr:spore cortex-lytic enzyme [Falsibacillus albus]RLQ95077.1 spore cortex-lytic enzyme [Falsibacillus albus]
MKNGTLYGKALSSILICVLLLSLSPINQPAQAFTNQVIQRGAVGDDVIELQARLQYIGYYTGQIDGVFGWGTYWALRNFQQKFGLPVDGLGGLKTRQKLVKASQYDEQYVKNHINTGKKFTYYGGVDRGKQGGGAGTATGGNKGAAKKPSTAAKSTAVNTPNGYSQNDIQLLANAVYGESRGEPYEGQVAVAAVILNRIDSPEFPNTISGVIFEPGAFTAVADGQIWLTPNETAKKAVIDAINGWDPSGSALYYFNPATATSGWIWSRPQIKQIGKHIFCK